MKTMSILGRVVLGLACGGSALSEIEVHAAHPTQKSEVGQFKASNIANVALQQGGILAGQVTDPQGIALQHVSVSVREHGRELARVVTDKEGRFIVNNLRGGIYRIDADQSVAFYRVWAPGSEPPCAVMGLTIVSDRGAVRGQSQRFLVPNYQYLAFGAAIGAGGYAAYRWLADEDEGGPVSEPLN